MNMLFPVADFFSFSQLHQMSLHLCQTTRMSMTTSMPTSTFLQYQNLMKHPLADNVLLLKYASSLFHKWWSLFHKWWKNIGGPHPIEAVRQLDRNCMSGAVLGSPSFPSLFCGFVQRESLKRKAEEISRSESEVFSFSYAQYHIPGTSKTVAGHNNKCKFLSHWKLSSLLLLWLLWLL